MNHTIPGTPLPRPASNSFLVLLHWGLTLHDLRTAELNAQREAASDTVTVAAEVRKAEANTEAAVMKPRRSTRSEKGARVHV